MTISGFRRLQRLLAVAAGLLLLALSGCVVDAGFRGRGSYYVGYGAYGEAADAPPPYTGWGHDLGGNGGRN